MCKYRYLLYSTRFLRYWMSGASPKSPRHETFVLRQAPRVFIYITALLNGTFREVLDIEAWRTRMLTSSICDPG